FGSKEALIDEIYRYRLPDIEKGRRAMLVSLDAEGRGQDFEMLLKAVWTPLFEQVDKDGIHIYGRFLRAMMRDGIEHTRQIVTSDYPTALELIARLEEKLPFGRGHLWELRWQIATDMVLDALLVIDNRKLGISKQARFIFEDAVRMASAALMASIDPQARF
ncbi:MAG: hypothetical protein KDE55_23750, partial [Novosphingobium sp.]|nr:hypothetical protein [Novosphingobium sp.]